MQVNCTCREWKQSWPQIHCAQVLASIHGDEYTGTIFKYCPWCGKEMILNETRPMDSETEDFLQRALRKIP